MSRTDRLIKTIEKLAGTKICAHDMSDRSILITNRVYQVCVRFQGVMLNGIGEGPTPKIAAEKALSELLERLVETSLISANVLKDGLRGSSVHRTSMSALTFAKNEAKDRLAVLRLLSRPRRPRFRSLNLTLLAPNHQWTTCRISLSGHRTDYVEVTDQQGRLLGNGFARATRNAVSTHAIKECGRRYMIAIEQKAVYSNTGVSKLRVRTTKNPLRLKNWQVSIIQIEFEKDIYFACLSYSCAPALKDLGRALGRPVLKGLFASDPTIPVHNLQ